MYQANPGPRSLGVSDGELASVGIDHLQMARRCDGTCHLARNCPLREFIQIMALRHLSLFALGSLLTTAAAQLRWERVPLFEGRSGHAAAFDASRGRLVVFGDRLH